MAEFEAISIDIGEGDSTLLKLPGDQWALIDVFRCENHGIDLFKLLDDRLPADGNDGRRRLDYLIITHAHDDHVRGLKDLVDRYDVREIWAPRYNTTKSLGEKFDEFKEVVDGHPNVIVPKGSRTPVANIGGGEEVSVRCFSPPGYVDVDSELTDEQQRQEVHEHCGVFKFEYEGISVMFTGDSDLKCWQRIISYYEDKTDENDLAVLDSTVIHASHHGSRTFFKAQKDDEAYTDGLEAIDPEAVIVSVGAQNRHEHPHDDAMKAYRDHVGETEVHETQEDGTLVLEVEADGSWRLDSDESFTTDYAWDGEDGGSADDDGQDGGSDGGQAAKRGYPTRPPEIPRRRRPKPDPEGGRTYG